MGTALLRCSALAAAALVLSLPCWAWAINVCCSIPDLADLCRVVGGSRVQATALARGQDDPHFVDAKPSFIKQLAGADALVLVGLELEVGWLPVVIQKSGNGRIQPGGKGYIDSSTVIQPLEVPRGIVDRSMGDVHPGGNPHFLLDPLNGLRVAALLRDRFTELDPAGTGEYRSNYEAFRRQLGVRLVGQALVQKYGDFEKLCALHEKGQLLAFLDKQGDRAKLEGWLGELAPYAGSKVVDDHPMWPYFARRFGLTVAGHLEPKPGIPPTSGHLQQIIELVKTQGVRVVITAPYYDPKHGAFVARNTTAVQVELAHQVGSVSGTDTYLDMCDYNVRTLAAAFRGKN